MYLDEKRSWWLSWLITIVLVPTFIYERYLIRRSRRRRT